LKAPTTEQVFIESGESMLQYRVFDLDSAGCLAGLPYEPICKDDEAAIAEAWQLRSVNGAEVWQGSRMVIRLPGRTSTRSGQLGTSQTVSFEPAPRTMRQE